MKRNFGIIFLFLMGSIYARAQTGIGIKSNNLFFEKVYLHTDRETYIGGEDIWYSVFLVNAQNHKLLNSSTTLYVELVADNQIQTVIAKQIIQLNNGRGFGDFKLSDSLSNGSYKLRAWTNWMRNFGDYFVFSKDIKILKSFDEQTSAKGKTANKQSQNVSIENASSKNQSQQIQFFPEGGSLVLNNAGIVAFKLFNIPTEVSGEIVDENGEFLTAFQSSNGVGTFTLLPIMGKKYFAKGIFPDGKAFNFPLPNALQFGYSIRVVDKDSLLQVIISSSESMSGTEKKVVLIGRNKGNICYKLEFPIQNQSNLVKIRKNDLPEGITAFTVYDGFGRPHAERLVYTDKKSEVTLSIIPDKNSYKPNEKVVLKLNALNSKKEPVKTSLSLTVFDTGVISENAINIISYFKLSSELKGEIERPIQYFDPNNINRLRTLDLLLLTQGWRDFVWRRLADTALTIKYVPEKGITLTGSVKRIFSEKPIANSNVTLFANGATGDKLFSAKTDSTGQYFIDNVVLKGSQILKITAVDNQGKKNNWLQLDSIFKKSVFKFQVNSQKNEVINQPLAIEMLRRNTIVKNKISIKDTIQLDEVKVKGSKTTRVSGEMALNFGYKPEIFNVTPSDYDFSNLGHFIRVKSNLCREVEDTSNLGAFKLVFPYSGKFIEPLIIVNDKEVPFTANDPQEVRDNYYNTYYSIQMNKVEKVVIKHLVGADQLGLSEESGMSTITTARDIFVIYLTLKPGALDPVRSYSIIEKISGYNNSRVFYQPLNNAKNSSADQRTTIYWNPLIVTDEKGEASVTFYNSSLKTKLNVVAEGISENGIPLVRKIEYQVK